jgi:trehalose/maltose hydrolase-like predicted phosphorylase
MVRQFVRLDARPGEQASVERFVGVATSRDPPGGRTVRDAADSVVGEAAGRGFDAALDESRAVWRRRWEKADVLIDGPARDQKLVRFSVFHLLQMAPFHSDRLSVPARGYSFNRYHGLYYWDTEAFLLPFYTFTFPAVARNLLAFRSRTLDGARRTARRLGGSGAAFPWMTDADMGTEQAPWGIGDYVWHQTADIARALDRYVRASGDRGFMYERGLEMLAETARFWLSKVKRDADGVFHLDGAVGPDELDEPGRDNGYTNLMVRRHLELAAHWFEEAGREAPGARRAVIERLGLGEGEVARWREVSLALGGAWQAVVMGFGGLVLRGGEVAFEPRLPGAWRSLAFSVVRGGRLLEVRVLPGGRSTVSERPPPALRLRSGRGERVEPPAGASRDGTPDC